MEAVEAAESEASDDRPLLGADGPMASLQPMWFTTFIIDNNVQVLLWITVAVLFFFPRPTGDGESPD